MPQTRETIDYWSHNMVTDESTGASLLADADEKEGLFTVNF